MKEKLPLTKVQDLTVTLKMLAGAKAQDSEVFLWRLIGERKYMASVRIEAIRKARGDFAIAPREGQEQDALDIIGSQTELDLYIPDYEMLLRCRLKQTDAPCRYYLQFPEVVAQLERRKSIRMSPDEREPADLKITRFLNPPGGPKQIFKKSCFDISSDGFSFLVSRAESKFFTRGAALPEVVFQIGKWSTKLHAEITQLLEVEPDEINGLSYKAFRVCCKITRMEAGQQQQIKRYIFERIKDELHVIND